MVDDCVGNLVPARVASQPNNIGLSLPGKVKMGGILLTAAFPRISLTAVVLGANTYAQPTHRRPLSS